MYTDMNRGWTIFLRSIHDEEVRMSSIHLSPVPRPVAIFDQYIAKQTETLALTEKISLSGDNFDVKLATGQPILRIEGTIMSISNRKSVYDMAGSHLFDIVKEHLHLHTTFAVHDRKGNKLLEVKSTFSRKYLYYLYYLFKIFNAYC